MAYMIRQNKAGPLFGHIFQPLNFTPEVKLKGQQEHKCREKLKHSLIYNKAIIFARKNIARKRIDSGIDLTEGKFEFLSAKVNTQ